MSIVSIARFAREKKRQLGQFFTPAAVAQAIVDDIAPAPHWRILEPSFGEGAFVFAVLNALRPQLKNKLSDWCRAHLYGCEMDADAYNTFCRNWQTQMAGQRPRHIDAPPPAMEQSDFFLWMPPGIARAAALNKTQYFSCNTQYFDLILGNPPFGGSICAGNQDALDAILGMREGRKIKKETYAFFIVKSLDLLKPGGRLVFICSDTMLTISTMAGLRAWLQKNFTVRVEKVPGAFEETAQGMILLSIEKPPQPEAKAQPEPRAAKTVTIFGAALPAADVLKTPNHSWKIHRALTKYFGGGLLGDKMVATSGMTIGKNELFVRNIKDGAVEEPFVFALRQEAVTLEKETARARLGRIPAARREKIAQLIAQGATETVLTWQRRAAVKKIALPHADYAYYNKALARLLYAPPQWAIFWRAQGDYVYTYKKNGNWYLHGTGGKKYFQREGLTWPLVASRLHIRYLPAGYILDSGAPCAFLRPGVPAEELFFILGWALTDLCNKLLKEVLNHTRNNQGKDFERLPYPFWVNDDSKAQAIQAVKTLLARAKNGEVFSFKSPQVHALENYYGWPAKLPRAQNSEQKYEQKTTQGVRQKRQLALI